MGVSGVSVGVVMVLHRDRQAKKIRLSPRKKLGAGPPGGAVPSLAPRSVYVGVHHLVLTIIFLGKTEPRGAAEFVALFFCARPFGRQRITTRVSTTVCHSPCRPLRLSLGHSFLRILHAVFTNFCFPAMIQLL